MLNKHSKMPDYITHDLVHNKDQVNKEYVNKQAVKILREKTDLKIARIYNLLNRINKMHTHDLFYLQQDWEAWLAPVYKRTGTTKSQLTQCTKY